MLKRPQTTHRVRKGVEPFEMNEAVCEPQLGSRGALNSVKICKKVTSPVRNAWREQVSIPFRNKTYHSSRACVRSQLYNGGALVRHEKHWLFGRTDVRNADAIVRMTL
jgi:hypothetical protein